MQDTELNSIKSQLENLKSLIFSNNTDLLSYTEKLYILISKNEFLNEEIEKRNMYFQELYSDSDFNNKILPPLIEKTWQDPSKEKIMAFFPICRYENAEELKKENWKGFYTDLFFESRNFDLGEAKLLGTIDKQTEVAYKKFCELAYEIPKEMYVREVHYYLTIIRIKNNMGDNIFYRKADEKFLTELLSLKEAALNLTSLVTYIITLIDSNTENNTIARNEDIKIKDTHPEKNTFNLNHPLTDEEIKILKLRKNLSPNNKYKNIAEYLYSSSEVLLTENNLKQKVKRINDKLGTNQIDDAIRIFETQFFIL